MIRLQRTATLTLVISAMWLTACTSKTPEQKLADVCLKQLNEGLGRWAKYSGWNTSSAKASLYKMEPDHERNQRFKTDQFYGFEVLINGFTVKNGFNADVNSVASCSGFVSKDAGGKYDPPMESLVSLTLNGEKLGL